MKMTLFYEIENQINDIFIDEVVQKINCPTTAGDTAFRMQIEIKKKKTRTETQNLNTFEIEMIYSFRSCYDTDGILTLLMMYL